MNIGELNEIMHIVARDKDYRHFYKRIKSDFYANKIDDKTSEIESFYIDNNYDTVGFCLVAPSVMKLKMWEKTFLEEEWVDKDFKMSPASLELMYMYVMPEYRKQKKAGVLLDKVIAYAKKNKIEEIYAYVSAPDNYALEFYKKKGAETIFTFSDDDGDANFTSFLRWKL